MHSSTSDGRTGHDPAALKTDGSVVTWGSAPGGGDSTTVAGRLTSEIVTVICAGLNGMAALSSDGWVVVWGAATQERDWIVPQLAGDVQSLRVTDGHFVAQRVDGSFVVWGNGLGQPLPDLRTPK